jgi:hypothetical protein
MLKWSIQVARGVDDFITDLDNVVDRTVSVIGERYGMDIAKSFIKDIRAHIEHQIFHHAPLTAAYADWKRKQNLDPRILIATGDYLDAIEAIPLDGGAGVGMRAGRHRNEDGSAGPEFDDLADWLENGTKGRRLSALRVNNELGGIPPRPHWQPMIERWTAKVAQLGQSMGDQFNDELLKELKKKGYISVEKALLNEQG